MRQLQERHSQNALANHLSDIWARILPTPLPRQDTTRQVETAGDALFARIQQRLPHRAALIGFGSALYDRYVVDHVLGHDVPASYLAGLLGAEGELTGPLLQRASALRRPVLIRIEDAESFAGTPWRANFATHGFHDCLVDVLTDPLIGRFCFASLFDLRDQGAQATRAMRSFCTLPVLDFWRREFAMLIADGEGRFSATEKELLHLLGQGKTNKQIALALGKSAATVRAQIHLLLEKTGARNRTELAVRYVSKEAS